MGLEIYQRAILTAALPADGLREGDVGTIVDSHVSPGLETR